LCTICLGKEYNITTKGDHLSSENRNAKEILNAWLLALLKYQGTDLHVKSNAPVRARIQGEIKVLGQSDVNASTVEDIVKLITASAYSDFMDNKEYDGAYMLNEQYRFRVNIYLHQTGYGLNLRLIKNKILTIEELNLPPVLHKLAKLERGLVLITGTTGSGKSTLLASIIEEINQTYNKHIITIEDPIEYTYKDKKSIIEQREIGMHTKNFSTALRSSMREDPDIIVVGEIRDLATAESILQAVNTGHLVFSTVHTIDAKETIDRMVSIFPTEEQSRVRATLASSLEAVISQRLIKGKAGIMIPSVEIMFKSLLIQDLIRNNKDNEINEYMSQDKQSLGSQTFNQSLYDLVITDKISEETAYKYASSIADLKLMLSLSDTNISNQEKELTLKETD